MLTRASRRISAACALAGLALVASACGGSGGGTAKQTTTTTAQDVAADKAAAGTAILRLSDFPSGWEQTAHTESTSGSDINAELAACVGVGPDVLSTTDNPTNVDSPDFGEAASGATVQSAIGFVETVAKARQAMAVFGRDKLPGCLATAMEKSLDYSLTHPATGDTVPTGLSFGKLEVSRLSFTNVADDTTALRVTVPIVVSAGTVNQYMDLVVVRVGRAAATLTLSRTDTPFDSSLAEHLATAVAGRLRGSGPTTTAAVAEATTTTTSPATASGVVPMAPSTAAEQAAVAAAATSAGRRWGEGNPNGSAEAAGSPFLGGYTVTLNDGKTQHAVLVLNGKVVPPFGKTGDVVISSAFGSSPTIAPQSAQQRTAVDAARAALADRFPTATRGGIELYVVYFPVQPNPGTYHSVSIFAAPAGGDSPFARGGTENR